MLCMKESSSLAQGRYESRHSQHCCRPSPPATIHIQAVAGRMGRDPVYGSSGQNLRSRTGDYQPLEIQQVSDLCLNRKWCKCHFATTWLIAYEEFKHTSVMFCKNIEAAKKEAYKEHIVPTMHYPPSIDLLIIAWDPQGIHKDELSFLQFHDNRVICELTKVIILFIFKYNYNFSTEPFFFKQVGKLVSN